MKVRADLNISLDGFGTTTDGTPEDPLGQDWFRLVDAYTATRTFRERVLGDTTGAGTTGVDDKYAAAYFDKVGAEIMGAGMFGLHMHPNDPDWHGWWGPNPPFRVPVFVLTHEQRPSLEMDGGTTFHFISATPQEALALAAAEADGLDIRIGGGLTVVRDFLKAGLVDELHVAIAPILLGQGVRLWDDLRGLESDYNVTTETAESGTSHVLFTRSATTDPAAATTPWRPAGPTL
ncbi:MAG: deaminase [Streptomycetaceae bacterium]|nr:deaminase [Streptomycetaceae bacterium]